MSSTRGDKENDSDEHRSNKRNRVSKFPSLKETNLSGGCDDEKPAAKKKQKADESSYDPPLEEGDEDALAEFDSGSNVPNKSRKKSNRGHNVGMYV